MTATMGVVAPRRRAIRVCVMRGGDLVLAGVAEMLARYPDRFAPVSPVGATVASVDVVLIDQVITGTDAVAVGQAQRLGAPVVVLVSSYGRSRPATGFAVTEVLVSTPYAELAAALELAHAHRGENPDPAPPVRSTWTVQGELSLREAQVVELICSGRSNVEIAQELFLSVNSIKTYIRSAYRKIDVTSRTQVLLWRLEQDRLAFESAAARSTPGLLRPAHREGEAHPATG